MRTITSFFSKATPLFLLFLTLWMADLQAVAADDSIQMLPPSNCVANKTTLLGWDTENPLVCVPGATIDRYGTLAVEGAVDSQTLKRVGGHIRAQGYVDLGEAKGVACNENNVGAIRYNIENAPVKTVEYCNGAEWQVLMPICRTPSQEAQTAAVNMLCSSGPGAVFWCMAYVNVVNSFNAQIQEARNQGDCETAKSLANQRNTYIRTGGQSAGGASVGVGCVLPNGAQVAHGSIREITVIEEQEDPKDPKKTIKVKVQKYCACSSGKVQCWDANL